MTEYISLILQIVETIAKWKIQVFLKPLLKFTQLVVLFLSLLTDKNKFYPEPAVIEGGESYDYIVVGGGTAGCVIANRLTENPNVTVLLIEAGGFPSYISDIPALFPLADHSTEEWDLFSTDDGYSSQGVKQNRVHMTAGKMLGGSSGITYLLYVRGAKADFDRWSELGIEGWDYNSVLPYFKKAEYIDDVNIYVGNTSYLHGKKGPMHVKKPQWDDRTDVYLKGFRQNGRPTLEDINKEVPVGFGLGQFTTDDHFRQNTGYTYIKPLKGRKNFSLLLHSLATKIIINEDKRATGVEVLLNNGEKVVVNAKREVIVCAGALNTPKLLMLSGIGPKKHLQEFGIDVIVDCPNVGQNFFDTPLVLLALTGLKGLLESFGENLLYFISLNSFPSPLIIGHGALNFSQPYADYQLNSLVLPAGSLIPSIFCSSIFNYIDETCIALTKKALLHETLFSAHILVHPESRGYIKLRSSNPEAPPDIYTGFYSNPKDLERHALYIRDYVSVIHTETFKSFGSRVVDMNLKQCSHLKFNSIKYWKCFILNLASPQWNFSGSCSMGAKNASVVDSWLRVYGVQGLRIADASVIPMPIAGNHVATVTMIGEKAADMIKEDQQYYCPENKQ